MRDAQDGWLDASSYLLERQYSFLPLPILITEPALDQGLGMSALFFHDNNREEDAEFVTPSVSAVAAAYTGNDSWFTGGGHRGIWRGDTLRYLGWAGYGSINLDYYGLSGVANASRGIEVNSEGVFTAHELLARVGESEWFVGGRVEYNHLDISLSLSAREDFLAPLEGDFSNAALGLAAEYDGRDTVFTPNKGNYLRFDAQRYDEALGGDFDFNYFKAAYRGFWQRGRLVAGLRADTTAIEGNAPFYSEPYIKLRGIPANRYQGETVAVLETELRWDFHPRISVVGFAGAGRAAGSVGDLDSRPTEEAFGFGVRYLLARVMGLRAGFDIARGPEDTVFYLTFGQNWSF
ncbi:MAG: BamA/TamA family outer membrane protein [Halioglobus sp.]